MPRPRFQNLAEEKRLALLEAAAKEFALYGYEQASLNRILEAGGMSKGAAYYYFDDKADVFVTAVRHYVDAIFVEFSSQLMKLKNEDFWQSYQSLYVEHLLQTTMEEPWRFGVARALFSLSDEIRSKPEVQAIFTEIYKWVDNIIEQGQNIGVIRTDLPKSLLLSIVVGIDSSVDNWFAQNGSNLPDKERELVANRAAECIKTVLKPQ